MDLGLDPAFVLPTPEEQALKEAGALSKLREFVVAHGGTWDDSWTCRMRFRVTARRNGKMGRTTDNYYYSPCGQSFRNYRQVAEFLRLSVDDGARGKPGPKAAKRPAPASPSAASGSSCDTHVGAGSPASPSVQCQQQQQEQQWGQAVPSDSPARSSDSGESSDALTSDDGAASAAAPAAKRARTKGAVAARRLDTAAPALALVPARGAAAMLAALRLCGLAR
ncbi:MAG: hypothetical protein J3K34DRAFT_520192 [Monoraphidium minutum]|nr:MAG: hypothetical protein J3K34DRAFT_520192 [Monoraphidium minutum]